MVGYLESRCRVEAFHNLGVVEEAVGSVPDGHHAPAAAVDVYAVHVAEGQPDVRGRLGQDGEALVGRVGALRQAQHGHRGQLVDGVQRPLRVEQHLGNREKGHKQTRHQRDTEAIWAIPRQIFCIKRGLHIKEQKENNKHSKYIPARKTIF